MSETAWRAVLWAICIAWVVFVNSLSHWGAESVLDAVTGQTAAAWLQALGALGAIGWTMVVWRGDAFQKSFSDERRFKHQVVFAVKICGSAQAGAGVVFAPLINGERNTVMAIDLSAAEDIQSFISGMLTPETDVRLLSPLLNAHIELAGILGVFRRIDGKQVGELDVEFLLKRYEHFKSTMAVAIAELRMVGGFDPEPAPMRVALQIRS